MSDYRRIKQTKYILEPSLYHKTLWRIRDFDRIKELSDSLLDETSYQDGEPCKTNKTTDKVSSIAIKREKYLTEMKIIKSCLNNIPSEYQDGVWNNVLYRKAYPVGADRATYGRWKSKFIYDVAMMFEKNY